MQKTTSTLLLFLCLTLKGFGQEANLDYTLKAIPVPEMGSAAINTKGQVAGIAFIDGYPVLHMWLPRPDYDLEAGVHSWPVPEELDGATFGILTKVSGFADNGTVLIENFFGSFRTSGYMYFQRGSFFPMFGWSTSNPLAYNPINISNSGIIYTNTDLIPNAANVNNHFGIRTEGPGVVSQTYAGEVLQTQSPNGPGNYIQAQGLRRGNSNGVHVAGDWIRDWSSEVFERFIPGTWDGRFVDRTPPGTTTRFAAIDINDKNQVLLVENGPPVPRAFVFLPERDYNLETAGYHEIIFADDVTPPGRLTRISGSGDIYRAGVGPLFYSLTKNDLLSADSLAMGSGIAVDAILQINDLGQLLIRGEDGTDGSNTFIISPNIVATVKVEPEQVEVGETFYLDVNITNTSDRPYTLTGVLGSSFKVFGTALAGLEQIVNPPGGPLEPGKSFQQKFSWKSSKSGKISFALQAVGFYSDQTQTLTPELRSNEVLIAPQGDLLVNYGDASDINWLGEELYQEIPIEPQRLESTIESTGGFEFKLRVKNNAEETKSFRLKAEELGLDDWDITYLYKAVGGTLPDITADILGPNGIGYTIPAEGEMDFAIQVSATDSTVSTQKSIILALTDPEVPDQTSDAVELVVNRSDITIDVSPKFPLVGHKATVTVKYQNNTEETVTDIKPTFIEAETATYRGGAEVELLTPEPTPPSVASLAPGETTEFVYEYRLKAEGKVDFEATINGRKGNGTFFYSPLGESRRVDIGKISVDEFELVQALPGVPLIGQKQTGMRITLKNTSPEPHDLTFLRILEADGKEISDPREVSDLPPGTRTFFSSVVGKDEESVYPELSSTPGKAEIILFEGDEEVQDYTGRSKQFSYEPKHTFPLDLTYATVRIKASDGLDIGVPPDIAAAIKSTHGNFINEVLPMPHTEFGSFHLPRTLLASDISEDANINLLVHILLPLQKYSLENGGGRTIGIIPNAQGFWPVTQQGEFVFALSMKNLKGVIAILGSEDLPLRDYISASKIMQTLGVPEAPAGGEPIEIGYAISGMNGEIIRNAQSLMEKWPQNPFINENQYRQMIGILSSRTPDPEVVIVSGYITQSDEVTADAWFTVLTDQVTEIQSVGTYGIEFLDSEGAVITNHQFESNFELQASLAPGSSGDAIIPVDISPFVFSLPRPEALSKVQITKENQVLFEREVTPQAPVLENVTNLNGSVLQANASQPIEWTATDTDGGELQTAISWSMDGGYSWNPVVFGATETTFDWIVPDQSTRTGFIRLRVTDGINTTKWEEGPFTIEGTEPAVIVTGGNDLMVTAGGFVALDGSGSYATDDRNLSYQWQPVVFPEEGLPEIENPDQAEATWTPIAEGDYLFRLTATDDEGNTTSTFKRVTVSGSILLKNDSLKVSLLPDGRIELRWAANLLVDLQNSGDLSIESWQQLQEASELEGEERVLRLNLEEFQNFFRLRISDGL